MSQGYLGYQDLMAEIAGAPVDKEARAKRWASLGITTKDFQWEGRANEGYATVYLQHGVPRHIAWYDWDLSEKNLMRNLENGLGRKVKLVNAGGGNGHYFADIEVLP